MDLKKTIDSVNYTTNLEMSYDEVKYILDKLQHLLPQTEGGELDELFKSLKQVIIYFVTEVL